MLWLSHKLILVLLMITFAGHSLMPPVAAAEPWDPQSTERLDRRAPGELTCSDAESAWELASDRSERTVCTEEPACGFCFVAVSVEFPVHATHFVHSMLIESFRGEGRIFSDRFRPPIPTATV